MSNVIMQNEAKEALKRLVERRSKSKHDERNKGKAKEGQPSATDQEKNDGKRPVEENWSSSEDNAPIRRQMKRPRPTPQTQAPPKDKAPAKEKAPQRDRTPATQRERSRPTTSAPSTRKPASALDNPEEAIKNMPTLLLPGDKIITREMDPFEAMDQMALRTYQALQYSIGTKASFNASIRKMKDNFKKEMEAKDKRLAEAENKLAQSDAKLAQADDKLAEAEIKFTAKAQEELDARKRIVDLNELNATLKYEAEEAENAVKQYQSRNDRLQQEVENLQSGHQQKDLKITMLEEQVDELQFKVDISVLRTTYNLYKQYEEGSAKDWDLQEIYEGYQQLGLDEENAATEPAATEQAQDQTVGTSDAAGAANGAEAIPETAGEQVDPSTAEA